MATALIVRNSPAEGPGLLSGLLEAGGVEAEEAYAPGGGLPEAPRHDLLVVLGAPEGANDPLPYLRREEGIIRGFVEGGRPVLGICLGAQLIARALGGRVYRGPRAEFGFARDLRPAAGAAGPLSGLGSPFAALHWHRDTFDLPPGAERLAGSDSYPNQAFSCGSAVGLQFHLEADAGSVRRWAAASGGELRAAGADPGAVLGGAARMLPEAGANMRRFYAEFASAAGL